ncbi:3,4-dihydroxy-2-butanone-4-phosphate synthase [Falsiroseomonas sp.]|uniref:3,4-dihydroxy-2-butanone-4-phosphate synthase n=1 Tax=Falsiroseomonas sp. TaxID=2870721 RepID=UPI003F7019B8
MLDEAALLIAEAQAGRAVVLCEQDGAEAAGALVVPAAHASAALIALMAREARGLVCLALTPERVRQLALPLLPASFAAPRPRFTVSIEAREGVSTGISAFDRARTIAVAIDATAGPEALVTPGHVFPLVAEPEGLLGRPGLVEAAVDLGRLSGSQAAGVLCQVLDEAGEVARGPALRAFAERHGLVCGTVTALLHHRLAAAPLLRRLAQTELRDSAGARWTAIAFAETDGGAEHLALLLGRPAPGMALHLHPGAALPGLLAAFQAPRGAEAGQAAPALAAMAAMREAGRGLVLCLDAGPGIGLVELLRRGAAAVARPAEAVLVAAILTELGLAATPAIA